MTLRILRALVGVSLLASQTTAFGIVPPVVQPPDLAVVQHAISNAVHSSHHVLASLPLSDAPTHLLAQYKSNLVEHPLPTKMLTGATLAVMGDAIAQSKNDEEPYDVPRAASFAAFDACYRALQHATFPIIVASCQGQYLGGALSSISPFLDHIGSDPLARLQYLAPLEQTLASQLGIVPFLYYPVFFALTGFMQGLSAQGSLDRAKENFIPLMKRNLLFWIPVQFVQFGFVEEGLQIPFLSVCGLAWTFILSVAAGSAKGYNSNDATDEVAELDDAVVSVKDSSKIEVMTVQTPEKVIMIEDISVDECSRTTDKAERR